jgi:hypothetical protein
MNDATALLNNGFSLYQHAGLDGFIIMPIAKSQISIITRKKYAS